MPILDAYPNLRSMYDENDSNFKVAVSSFPKASATANSKRYYSTYKNWERLSPLPFLMFRSDMLCKVRRRRPPVCKNSNFKAAPVCGSCGLLCATGHPPEFRTSAHPATHQCHNSDTQRKHPNTYGYRNTPPQNHSYGCDRRKWCGCRPAAK